MSEKMSTGLLFKEALKEFSEKHKEDSNICGVKIDLRAQGIDMVVGIRFIDGESHYAVCAAGTNCEGADDSVFDLLSDAFTDIGIESKSGAAIMVKRNAQLVPAEEGCAAIETVKEGSETAPKKRGGLFGLFGKK
ncbi:MAG: hypothetical protein PF439_12055 [Helicobacteraceae bacterium]|jgi:hypothetical protein|nr:hypothetical protein [Helicobacteraceae bacterium]